MRKGIAQITVTLDFLKKLTSEYSYSFKISEEYNKWHKWDINDIDSMRSTDPKWWWKLRLKKSNIGAVDLSGSKNEMSGIAYYRKTEFGGLKCQKAATWGIKGPLTDPTEFEYLANRDELEKAIDIWLSQPTITKTKERNIKQKKQEKEEIFQNILARMILEKNQGKITVLATNDKCRTSLSISMGSIIIAPSYLKFESYYVPTMTEMLFNISDPNFDPNNIVNKITKLNSELSVLYQIWKKTVNECGKNPNIK